MCRKCGASTSHRGSSQNLSYRYRCSTCKMWVAYGSVLCIHPYGIRLHPSLTEMTKDRLLIGWDMWKLGITCVQYYNCFFYIDDHAPAEEVDLIHVGRPEMSDNQRRGAGFQMAYWVPNNILEQMQMIMNNNTLSEETIPMAVRMGRNDRMPLYPRGWLILESQASAIADRAQVTYAQVGAYRWKNIRIMNLAA